MVEAEGVVLVVAVALQRGDGAILMQQRPLAKQHGGLWEFPGGKVEQGEAPAVAAARELAEELGVVLLPADLAPVGFAEGQSGKRTYLILLYRARRWQGAPQALEAEALDWFAPDAIPALAMPPLDYPLAQALLRMEGQG